MPAFKGVEHLHFSRTFYMIMSLDKQFEVDSEAMFLNPFSIWHEIFKSKSLQTVAHRVSNLVMSHLSAWHEVLTQLYLLWSYPTSHML